MTPGRIVVTPAERPSLHDAALAPLWEAVRCRLERTGSGAQGRVRLPLLDTRARFLLAALLGRTPGAFVDLAALESALRDLGAGHDLAAALEALGVAVSPEPARRRRERKLGAAARDAARAEAAAWPEPWAGAWIDSVVRAGTLAGLMPDQSALLVRRARAVLDAIDAQVRARDAEDAAIDAKERPAHEAIPKGRVDLAAGVLGSSHALDRGTREEAAVTRALELRHDVPGRWAWEAAGIDLDLVSAPVLTWRLRPSAGSALAGLLAEAERLGMPLHLSRLALRATPVTVPAGQDILVAENPRVVEAAAQGKSPLTVVALNGNPSGAAQLLLHQLLRSGAALRYHGDFDAAGLRICAAMHRLGLEPWAMGSAAYLGALAAAEAEGTSLPRDPHRSPPTPWDPGLQEAFDVDRRIVHEERLLRDVLAVPGR